LNGAASASDNIGVARVEFYLDGTLAATDTTSPISNTLRAVFRDCRERPVVSEYVFVDGEGRRFNAQAIDRYHHLALAIAGITRHVRVHDLRHSFGSTLASGKRFAHRHPRLHGASVHEDCEAIRTSVRRRNRSSNRSTRSTTSRG
jgi:integrase